jgi:hypothetical protein
LTAPESRLRGSRLKRLNREVLTALGTIVLGGVILSESLRMPRFEHLGVNPYTVPGLVPGVLGAIILLLGGFMLVRDLLAVRPPLPGDPAEAAAGQAGGWRNAGTRKLVLTLVLTLGYAGLLVGRLPFAWATGIFVFLFIIAFEWQRGDAARLLRVAGIALFEAILVAVGVTLIFEKIFLVRLP